MRPTTLRSRLVECRVAVVTAALTVLGDGVIAFVGPRAAPLIDRTDAAGPASARIFKRAGIGSVMPTEQDVVGRQPCLPPTVKGILFDMDGTLTDSDTLHFEAYRETFLKV